MLRSFFCLLLPLYGFAIRSPVFVYVAQFHVIGQSIILFEYFCVPSPCVGFPSITLLAVIVRISARFSFLWPIVKLCVSLRQIHNVCVCVCVHIRFSPSFPARLLYFSYLPWSYWHITTPITITAFLFCECFYCWKMQTHTQSSFCNVYERTATHFECAWTV